MAAHPAVESVHVLQDDVEHPTTAISTINIDYPSSSKSIRTIARESSAEFVLLFLQPKGFLPNYRCIDRMLQVAKDTHASMVYADRWELSQPLRYTLSMTIKLGLFVMTLILVVCGLFAGIYFETLQ